MKKDVRQYDFEKMPAKIAKEFGTIPKGKEENYEMLLFPIESNLVKASRIHHINNGRRVLEAITICLFIIDGYLRDIEYDLSSYTSSENKAYIHAILMSFDPFSNSEIMDLLKEKNDLTSKEYLKEYFKNPLICLLRLAKSVEKWTKEMGIQGYFDFVEKFLGHRIPHDENMNFSILSKISNE